MQTNNNNFIPQATTPNEHERTSNMGWLMLLVGFLLGCLIATGVVAAWAAFGEGFDAAEVEEQDKRAIKEVILEKIEDGYSEVLKERPIALDVSDIHVTPSSDVEGEYEVYALLSVDDPAIEEKIEKAIRENVVPAGTQAKDLLTIFVTMKATKDNGDWEMSDANSYLGQSLWYLETSLQEARNKGRDAAIKSTINNLRAQAEIYYDNNNRSYSGFEENDEWAMESIDAASDSSPGSAQCKSSTSAYRCSAPLVEEDSFYCIDDSGFAGVVSSDPADISGYDCP